MKRVLFFLCVLGLFPSGELLAQEGAKAGSEPRSVSSETRLNIGLGPSPSPTPTPKGGVEVDTHGKGISEIFELANAAYESDDLETAIAYYRAIEERGLVNGHLYFNMGNTYFRMGDFGHAVLYYEKARKLHPRDRDLLHNLAYAKTFLIDKDVSENRLPGSLDSLLFLHRETTLNETFLLLGVLNLLFVLCLLVKRLRFSFTRKFYFGYIQGSIAILLFLQMVSAGFKVWEESQIREAIVLEDAVKATAAPASEETLFELNSGTKVKLLESRNGYARIVWNGTPAFVEEEVVGEI